jgi:hypothetical protein
MVAHNPLNRSGRADFPHPALASGDKAEAMQRIWVMDLRSGQPVVSNSPHPIPHHPTVLAAPRQRAMPEPNHVEMKHGARGAVHRDTVISIVPLDHRVQPLAHFRDGIVHAPLEFGLNLTQLGLQPFADRLSKHREPSVASLLPTDVSEAEEVEGLGLSFPTPLSVLSRIRAGLQKAGLVGMQLQLELAQSRMTLSFTTRCRFSPAHKEKTPCPIHHRLIPGKDFALSCRSSSI